uniref:NR LBD domain-containing protein n=1 Tax=Panagrolaimus superbus TaxID=310955 RepID=A0A914YDA5_9BILA
MCRSCRHIKCITVGMKAESVQLNRDTIGKQSAASSKSKSSKAKKELSSDSAYQPSLPLTLTPISDDQTPTPPSTSPLSSAGLSQSSIPNIANNYEEAEWEISNKLNRVFEDAFLNPRTSTDLSIIEQFQIGYRHLCTKRPMIHQTRFIDFTAEMFQTLPENEIDRIFYTNWEALIKQHEVEIDLLAELMSFIRPFVELPKDQRWLLFKYV